MRPSRFDRQVTVDAPDIKDVSPSSSSCHNKKLEEDLSLKASPEGHQASPVQILQT